MSRACPECKASLGQGFQCKLFIARDEKRIIESGPAGIRLLAAEVLYEEMAWPLLIQPA
ncbi:hypothetical protein ACFQNF_09710 [Iodobacter arcticus]|uniref:Uncharacterized protein n=1 Tax=Iodobacter arcticus TaxID=590593 RepID=A0ABW2QYK4_9NEIS